MAPDDIPVEHPASETQRKPTGQLDLARRSIGPEGEVRGGPEAPDSAPDTSRQRPVDAGWESDPRHNSPRDNSPGDNSPGHNSSRGSPGKNREHKAAGGSTPSDPPKPPGVPPEVPKPDERPPIEEPPNPIPVPPNDPPEPIVATSWRPSGWRASGTSPAMTGPP
jgi:hypothetical protein